MATNVPVTIWRDTNGLTEYSSEGANDIADPLGNHLVDVLNNQIVDTGVTATPLPATVWTENDAL